LKLVRIYADHNGHSHFGEIELKLSEREFCPPSPTGYTVTDAMPATEVRILRTPAGYVDDWHPAPGRVLATLLSGTLRVETSDGDSRMFDAGDQFLCEDIIGQGHRMMELAGRAYDMALVMLA